MTLVSAVGAAGALAICLILLYVALGRQLGAALDADLTSRAGDLAAAVRSGDTAELSGDPIAQLYASDGRLVAGSASVPGRLLRPDEVRDVLATEGTPLTTRSLPVGPRDARIPVRLLSQPVGDRVLTVGVSAEPIRAARERLAAVLFIAAPLLVALLALAARTVVRTALRPVDALTGEAADISSLETERRLPDVPGDDEIARLARTLNEMLARLRTAAERERAFIDDASHELRTPIAVLRGELELALAAGDLTEVERSLRAALGESERLSRLADDLLLLARARAGTLAVRTEPVDLYDLATAESRRLGPILGVRIEVTGDPVVIDADPERLRQILANLAGNSATAGATTVQVRIEAGRDAATIEVADDGPGFPPHLLDAAFARFARGTDARTRNAPGAGLGLSIVQAIVTAHGGTVTAHNGDPLGGAVVTTRLPATAG